MPMTIIIINALRVSSIKHLTHFKTFNICIILFGFLILKLYFCDWGHILGVLRSLLCKEIFDEYTHPHMHMFPSLYNVCVCVCVCVCVYVCVLTSFYINCFCFCFNNLGISCQVCISWNIYF